MADEFDDGTDRREARERVRETRDESRGRREEARRRYREAKRRYKESIGRKERVLHTRISEQLAGDIRRVAEELRVPVSNIVRNVLEEAFGVVEAVTENVGDLVEDIIEEAGGARDRIRQRARARARREDRHEERDVTPPREEERERPEFPEVIGWQPLILNGERSCAGCPAGLERGEHAFLGLTGAGTPGPVLCQDCMRARE